MKVWPGASRGAPHLGAAQRAQHLAVDALQVQPVDQRVDQGRHHQKLSRHQVAERPDDVAVGHHDEQHLRQDSFTTSQLVQYILSMFRLQSGRRLVRTTPTTLSSSAKPQVSASSWPTLRRVMIRLHSSTYMGWWRLRSTATTSTTVRLASTVSEYSSSAAAKYSCLVVCVWFRPCSENTGSEEFPAAAANILTATLAVSGLVVSVVAVSGVGGVLWWRCLELVVSVVAVSGVGGVCGGGVWSWWCLGLAVSVVALAVSGVGGVWGWRCLGLVVSVVAVSGVGGVWGWWCLWWRCLELAVSVVAVSGVGGVWGWRCLELEGSVVGGVWSWRCLGLAVSGVGGVCGWRCLELACLWWRCLELACLWWRCLELACLWWRCLELACLWCLELAVVSGVGGVWSWRCLELTVSGVGVVSGVGGVWGWRCLELACLWWRCLELTCLELAVVSGVGGVWGWRCLELACLWWRCLELAVVSGVGGVWSWRVCGGGVWSWRVCGGGVLELACLWCLELAVVSGVGGVWGWRCLELTITSDTHTYVYIHGFLQIYCFTRIVSVEICNLAVMSYDRTDKTNPEDLGVGEQDGDERNYYVLCGNNINKVYCDNFPVVKLACSDTTVNNVYGLFATLMAVVVPLMSILFSYAKILRGVEEGGQQDEECGVEEVPQQRHTARPVVEHREEDADGEVDEDDEVRSAGAQGLPLGVLGGLQAHRQNLHVGQQNADEGQHHQAEGDKQAVGVDQAAADARQLDHRQVVTEQLVDGEAAERQARGQVHLHRQQAHRHQVGHGQQPCHPGGGNDTVVLQRPADGDVSVVGHHRQEGVGAGGVHVDAEHLQQAAPVGHERRVGQQALHYLGAHGAGAQDAVERQVQQEGVHGLVERWVAQDQHHQQHVGRQRGAVQQQAEDKEEVVEGAGGAVGRQRDSRVEEALVHEVLFITTIIIVSRALIG
ncbi:hypothetical protein CRUP_017214 [Coryphaenoides rupestris]|nr:hypothetical protein CRUP_017214 [Coryphaenoides rupestris]